MSEWTVASRHNRDARCNCLMPVLSRVPPPTPVADTPQPTLSSPAESSATAPTPPSSSKQKSPVDVQKTLDSTFATNINTCSSTIVSLTSLNLNTRLAVHDVKLLLMRFAHGRPFHGETGGGAKESNMNLLPHLMQVVLYEMAKEQTAATEKANIFALIARPESHWSSAASACWDTSGPLYTLVTALHLLPQSDWCKHRADLLRHLMALAFSRATFSEGAFTKPPPVSFDVYKPYLLFFALINSLYAYHFKNVTVKEEETTTSSSDDSLGWRKALSDMIRASDEELLAATPKLFVFFESDISPVESMSEFLDVVEMNGEVEPDELTCLATLGKRTA